MHWNTGHDSFLRNEALIWWGTGIKTPFVIRRVQLRNVKEKIKKNIRHRC